MNGTEIAAWWGAIIATTVLLWDIVKWSKAGPYIRATAKMPTHYPDAEVLSVDDTENGTVTTYVEYCHVEVINSGNLPTTIISLTTTHKKGKNKIQASNNRFTSHNGKKLPCIIGPGEIWSCRVKSDIVTNIAQHGKPIIEIRFSHKEKPINVEIINYANK